jgi:carbon storage regulator CsrA
MLVLSRKIGQEITIGSDVRVVVHRISGNRVTLGIEAPREVSILRGELEPLTNSHLEPKEPTSSLLLPDFTTKDDSNYTDLPRSPR